MSIENDGNDIFNCWKDGVFQIQFLLCAFTMMTVVNCVLPVS